MQENVGRYRIVRQLGKGAMGLVFLAEDPSLNRQVAIKMLDVEADSESDRAFLHNRLLRDARAAAVLSHPNIVAVYDIVEEGNSVYVVMEYIEGETLAAYLDHTPTPQHSFVADAMRQAAAALDYTHSKGIIHRDIKPGNIMISQGGVVKILDFGIARMSDVRTSTPTGIVMGTVDYMAPEQIKAAMIDGRADQFSLAAVAYRMLAGSTLFGRHTLATLAYKLVNEVPESVCLRNSAIPPEVDKVLGKALSKNPPDRYLTCGAFAEDLGRALIGAVTALGAAATPTSTITVRTAMAATPPPPKRSIGAAWVAGGVLLAAAAGGIAVWKPWEKTATQTDTRMPSKAPEANIATPEPTPVTTPDTSIEKQPPKATAVLPTPVAKAPTPSPKTIAKTQTVPSKAPEVTPPQPVKPPDTTVRTPTPAAKPPEPITTPPPPIMPEPTKAGETNYEVDSKEATGTPFHRGVEQMKARDYKSAVDSFSIVVKNRPKSAQGFYNRGYSYEMLGAPVKAIEDFSQAIKLNPRSMRALANRGICEVRLHQDDLAFADFNRALDLDPNYAGALNGRGGILLRRKQYKLAILDFTAAIKANPQFAQAYENRSNARRATGDLFGAEDDQVVARRLGSKK